MNDIAEADVATAAGAGAGHGHARADGRADARTRTDTRARIQQVAVELFTEHGYEATSLREIAERLDVTKAALYYHFKSKEDIIRSLVEDYRGQMDDLVSWARSQGRTPQARREIITRYLAMVAERDQVFRMLHQNQAAVDAMPDAIRSLKAGPLVLVDLRFLLQVATVHGDRRHEHRLDADGGAGGRPARAERDHLRSRERVRPLQRAPGPAGRLTAERLA